MRFRRVRRFAEQRKAEISEIHCFVRCTADRAVARIAARNWADHSIRLWDADTGARLATLFTQDDKGIGFTPDGLFFGDADPRDAFAIVRGSEKLPMDDFIALDRRDSLA